VSRDTPIVSLWSALGLTHSQYSRPDVDLLLYAPSLPLWCWRVAVLPVFSAAAVHGLMQHSPTASRRPYAAHRRARIARGSVGLVSSLTSRTGSRGVVLGPLAGSYRSRIRDIVTLDGRSAGL
jgi:hypothetical protein